MLQRIEQIQGIGLFHDVYGKSHKWQKATLLYAENGRGKSTLAAILRSAGSNDPAPILERKTIDGTLSPKVTLQFSNGHKVTFDGEKWSEHRTEIMVFDTEFIEKNVHSGGTIDTNQRKNLLQFALGEKAVIARQAEEEATAETRKANELVTKITQQLSGYHSGMTFEKFEKLISIDEIDLQFIKIDSRIAAARGIAEVQKRAIPKPISVPSIDFPSIFTLLNTTLDTISDDAEAKVRAHLFQLNKQDAEVWLSQGQTFDYGDYCPYCTQSITGIDLLKAYKTYFNAAYVDLRGKISTLEKQFLTITSDSIVNDFAVRVEGAVQTTNVWNDNLSVPEIRFNTDDAQKKLSELRTFMLAFITQKQLSPTSSIGTTEDLAKAQQLWEEIIAQMSTTNQQIDNAITTINNYRQKLIVEDVKQLTTQLTLLEFTKKRYSQDVISLFDQLIEARNRFDSAEKSKDKARSHLEELMKKTLGDYKKSINDLLKKFGVSFQIEDMDLNFRGKAPRSEYGLTVREKSIRLDGVTTGVSPTFATALSEGDKRTLAFAFFVASTLSDSELNRKIVVIDDPMSSLDQNRKRQTRTVLKQIYAKALQLIVFAHDPYFILELRNEIERDEKTQDITVLCLKHTTDEYSTFYKADLDNECQSSYYAHHQFLYEFVNQGTGDTRQVAKAIRPLLEGYLNRRFPGIIPRNLMFGQITQQIASAKSPSPLCFAQDILAELDEINSYACKFHHDTNPDSADNEYITHSELKAYASRALNIIYKGTQ